MKFADELKSLSLEELARLERLLTSFGDGVPSTQEEADPRLYEELLARADRAAAVRDPAIAVPPPPVTPIPEAPQRPRSAKPSREITDDELRELVRRVKSEPAPRPRLIAGAIIARHRGPYWGGGDVGGSGQGFTS